MNLDVENQILHQINSTNWNEYDGPEYYNAGEIISVLTDLANVKTEKRNNRLYNDVLFAVGNNHSGTYYPVVLKALPVIMKIAEASSSEVSRNCTLKIISDLYCCFDPELGTYNKITVEELRSFVRTTIRHFVEEHKGIDSDRNMQLIADLMEFMREEESNV